MTPVTSKVAATSAGPIEYVQIGSGPAVLWLHGTPGGYDQAAFVAGGLTELGFTVVCPSRPGYLRTPLDVGRTAAEQADALAALLDVLAVPTVGVIATSGGGPVALTLAGRRAGRVWALVMLSAVSRAYQPPGSPLARRIVMSPLGAWLLDHLHRCSPMAATRALLHQQSTFTAAALQDALAQVKADPAKQQFVAGLIATTRPFRPRQPGTRNDLRQAPRLGPLPTTDLRCPLLVIHGDSDAQVPIDQARSLAAAVPGAQLVEVPGAAHLLPLSKHAAHIDHTIATFLREHAPSVATDHSM